MPLPAFCHFLGRVFNKLCQISLFAVLPTGPDATLYWTILESSFRFTVWHHLYIWLFSLSWRPGQWHKQAQSWGKAIQTSGEQHKCGSPLRSTRQHMRQVPKCYRGLKGEKVLFLHQASLFYTNQCSDFLVFLIWCCYWKRSMWESSKGRLPQILEEVNMNNNAQGSESFI